MDYVDFDVAELLQYGWPINYTSCTFLTSSDINHQSALSYRDRVQHYLETELSFQAIAGPFQWNPLHQALVTSPLQKVNKRGSTKRRVVMDLSFPHSASVNGGIPKSQYLDTEFQLRLPGIDRLCEFVRKGQGCFIYKKDLRRAYRQIPIDPKDFRYLGFQWDNSLYFDLRCPFGLRSSAMICQRLPRRVIRLTYIWTIFMGLNYPQSRTKPLRDFRNSSTSWDWNHHLKRTVFPLPE